MNQNSKLKKNKAVEKATRVKVAEPEVLCQSLMPAPLNQGETALRATPNLNYIFFEPTRAVPDGPFVSPIVGTARMLKALGVNPDDLKASLTVSMALNSARLGYSIPTILLSKEPSAAVKVLHRCMQVTPSVSFIEFQMMTQEDLFLGSPQIRERTVTSSDENGFKKVRQDVDLLLSRGNSTTQELIRSKLGVGLQSRRVEIPLSLVGVAPDRASSVLQHPSLLWVSVRGEQEKAAHAPRLGNGEGNPLLDVEVARLQKTFERLCWHPVEVPFANQITGPLKDTKAFPACQVENIFKILCLATIINNPPAVHWDEIASLMYGVGKDKVGRWLAAKKDLVIPRVKTEGITTLAATKVDYFFAWLLLDKMLPVGEFILTPRQNRILDVLKRLNMAGISNAHINHNSVIDILSTIANSNLAWMTREKVFETLNKEGGEYVSLSTVNNELQYLLKVGIIARNKPPKQNQYRYYILTLDAGQYLALPHPSEIKDPIYKGQPVEVVNPLTGAVENI